MTVKTNDDGTWMRTTSTPVHVKEGIVLSEVTAPKGYKPLKGDIKITGTNDLSQISVESTGEDTVYEKDGITYVVYQKEHYNLAECGKVTLKYQSMTYTGKKRTQNTSQVIAVINGKEELLEKDVDYTITYKDAVNVGKATMIIQGIGRFEGSDSIKKTYQIKPRNLADCVKVKLGYNTMNYTGRLRTKNEKTKVYAIINGNTFDLEKEKDYTIEYINNKNAGEATIIIHGIGNFEGSDPIKKTFTIKSIDLSKKGNVSLGWSMMYYTGKARTQDSSTKVTAIVNDKIKVLKKGTDYEVEYLNNTKIGKVTMVITGINNFSGTIKKTFKIIAKAAA